MPGTNVVESAIAVGVNRALSTAADAAHHAVSTPASMVIEGVKSATVFIAAHVVMGGLKLGCTTSWWLITTAASLVGVAVGAGTSLAYNTLFASPREQPKMLTWNNSYDLLDSPLSKSVDDSTRLLEASPSTTPRAVSPSMTRNVAGID